MGVVFFPSVSSFDDCDPFLPATYILYQVPRNSYVLRGIQNSKTGRVFTVCFHGLSPKREPLVVVVGAFSYSAQLRQNGASMPGH